MCAILVRSPTPRALHRALLAWYRRHARDLPWRGTTDPYAIWISEIMLQQTQVKTVLPYYDRFLGRFPDVRALADAPLDDVLRVWAGLGYYSRARNLHAAARRILEEHDGKFPDTEAALRALPGVGRYTAGAILSIAFGRDTPVVDGNVMRVLSRVFAIGVDPRSARGQTRFWDVAERLVPEGKASGWNQALMELGALVCVPDNPACFLCPALRLCRAHEAGAVDRFPLRPRRRKAPVVEGICAIARRGGRLLFVQRPETGLLGGLWEFPTADLAGGQRGPAAARAFLEKGLGLRGTPGAPLGTVRHLFTHRDLRLTLYPFEVTEGRVRAGDYRAHRWIRIGEAKDFPLSVLTEKVCERLADHEPERRKR
jgi:A/G-specific adenine glycosylase